MQPGEILSIDDSLKKEVDDALEALIVLGYARKVAEKGLASAIKESKEPCSVGDLIKQALNFINKV